jgi:uncharacterized LabA/DUF88 family protein
MYDWGDIMDNFILDEACDKQIKDVINSIDDVCIFIDYDNLFHTMKRYAIDVTSPEYNICSYFNTRYGLDKIRSFRAYADFDQVNVQLRKLQEERVQIRNVYGNNREDKYRKNASDIELSIDVIESTYKNESVDTYVIVTSDSDMIPIMSRLKYKKKKIHLYYTSQNTSQTVKFNSFCDFSCDLLKLFCIDINKGKPEYWFDKVKNIISDWYKNPQNLNKSYGFSWLKKDIAEKCNLSEQYASEIINLMIDNGMVEGISNGNYITIKIKNVDKKRIQ